MLANNHLSVELGASGVVQLWDGAGRPQLQAPLVLSRFRDHGEFWDAWDLPADYRDHPLPVQWDAASLDVVESGPLVARVLMRARVGESRVRMDCQLRADTPWVELTCSVAWRQTHELLRLEVPLAQSAMRWAADTSGGVITRPARACTPGEQMRWEVPVISWCATEAASPGGGLALLLDGPQGVGVTPGRLGVSLVRGATWPDPGADRGWHRQRLALMPAPQGWCRGGIPQAAIAFREPGWWGPAGLVDAEQWLPPLPNGLVPVAVGTPRDAGRIPIPSTCLHMRVLNPGARRQFWHPPGWVIRRLGGTVDDQASVHSKGAADGGCSSAASSAKGIVFRPGELVEVALTPLPGHLDQSS